MGWKERGIWLGERFRVRERYELERERNRERGRWVREIQR